MVKVIGIDVGIVNMSICMYDSLTNTFHAENGSLLEAKSNPGQRYVYNESLIAFLCEIFLQDRIDLIKQADLILIENQMRKQMLIIQHSIASYLLGLGCIQVRFVHPRAVRVFFDISMKNYEKNKAASVAKFCSFIKKKEDLDKILRKNKKLDDVADSFLISLYGVKNIQKFDSIQVIKNESSEKKRKPLYKKKKTTK